MQQNTILGQWIINIISICYYLRVFNLPYILGLLYFTDHGNKTTAKIVRTYLHILIILQGLNICPEISVEIELM